MRTIALERANTIVGKIGHKIRRATSSERKDFLYSGIDNPRWVIDMGCFKPHRAFGSVYEAFQYLCKKEFVALQEIELSSAQRELVRRAVYDEEI